MYYSHITAVMVFTGLSNAVLDVVNPNMGSCTDQHAVGNFWSCYSGIMGCRFNGEDVPCNFPKGDEDIGHSFCGANEAIVIPNGYGSTTISNGQKCGSFGDYTWVMADYKWKCCGCPAEYRPAGSYSPSTDGHGGFTYDTANGTVDKTCMRCTGAGEVLTYNQQKYEWSCVGGNTATKTHTKTETKTHNPPTSTPKPPKDIGCKASGDGIELISELEGYHSDFYSVFGVKMIGYGHNCDTFKDCGKTVKAPLSKKDAMGLLHKDLVPFEKCIGKLPNAKSLNKNQFDALLSFAYNQGCAKTLSAFGKLLEARNFKQVCVDMASTNTHNGDLSQRRQREAKRCATPTNIMSGC